MMDRTRTHGETAEPDRVRFLVLDLIHPMHGPFRVVIGEKDPARDGKRLVGVGAGDKKNPPVVTWLDEDEVDRVVNVVEFVLDRERVVLLQQRCGDHPAGKGRECCENMVEAASILMDMEPVAWNPASGVPWWLG